MAYKSKYGRRRRILSGLLTIFTLLFAAMMVLGLGMAVQNLRISREDQQAFRELAELVEAQQTKPAETIPGQPEGGQEAVETPQSPYQVLYDQNEDFVAWLTVPGTAIDYPVVYTPEDVDKYIYRSFDGSESPSGTPFVGDYGDLYSQKAIIYGHNMKDGTMFHDLLDYGKKAFWQENPTFTIHTLEEERTYEIFAAVRSRVLTQEEQGLRYHRLPDGVEDWLLKRSLYDTGIVPQEGDNIVILSTCSYHTEEGRFLVAGRMIKE